MTKRAISNQIVFRYRATDSANGAPRKTAKPGGHLGVGGTQAIDIALHDLAVRVLFQYEADDGALTAAQMHQIKTRVPQGGKRSVHSSLFPPNSI